MIRDDKTIIASYEDDIISQEQELGGRGESKYYKFNYEVIITTSYYDITIDTECSQRLINRNIKLICPT